MRRLLLFCGGVAMAIAGSVVAQVYNFFPPTNSTLTTHGVLVGSTSNAINSVAAMAADTLLQGQGTSADPVAVAVNNCGDSTHALSYNTSTHAFGCQSIVSTTACTHGTATIAATGFSGTANSHLFWEKCGDGTNFMVVLHIQVSGTSNSTAFSISGLTSNGINPANSQESTYFSAIDNGANIMACAVVNGDTVSFFITTQTNACNGSWTSTGTKGFSAAGRPITISYVMD